MRALKGMRIILTFLFSLLMFWSLSGHAFSCVDNDSSHISCESDANPNSASPANHCHLGCSPIHYTLTPGAFLKISEPSLLLSFEFPSYLFLYDQPDIGFEPFPPIQA